MISDQLQSPPYWIITSRKGYYILQLPQVILMTRQAWEIFHEKISSLRKEPYFTNLHINLAQRRNNWYFYWINNHYHTQQASLVAQMVKNLPARQETWVWSLGWEDPLEEGMATHSSILAYRIPWTEEPGGLQAMGLQRVRQDWATKDSTEYITCNRASLLAQR